MDHLDSEPLKRRLTCMAPGEEDNLLYFLGKFVILLYQLVSARISDVSANPDTYFSHQKNYVVPVLYQLCIRGVLYQQNLLIHL